MSAWTENLDSLPPPLKEEMLEEIRQSLLRGEGFDSLLKILADYEATGEYYATPGALQELLQEASEGGISLVYSLHERRRVYRYV